MAAIGLRQSSHLLSVLHDACNDGSHPLGSEMLFQLLTSNHQTPPGADQSIYFVTLLSSDIIFSRHQYHTKLICLINRFAMSSLEQDGPSNTAGGSSFARKSQKLVVADFGMGGSGDHPWPTYAQLRLDQPRALPPASSWTPTVGFAFPRKRQATVMSTVRKVEIANDMHDVPPSGQIVEVEALENQLAYRLGGEAAPFATKLLDQVAGSASELPTEAIRVRLQKFLLFIWFALSPIFESSASLTWPCDVISSPDSGKDYCRGWRTRDGVGAGPSATNRDLCATNETLRAELLNAKFQIGGSYEPTSSWRRRVPASLA
uniref:Uncharacterized protein n=1 Tax=Cannabis sativa TaxID=3483 RepID=A0A803QCZ7_CANSA